jgi:hypothetical protein
VRAGVDHEVDTARFWPSRSSRRVSSKMVGATGKRLVVGYDHPPFASGELTFADLGGHRWVTYPSAMPMQALLQREMDLAGAQVPVSAISTASTFVTVALLQCSADLVSVLPAGVARLFCKHRMLRTLPIGFKSKSQTFGIVTRKVGVLSPSARQFVRAPDGRKHVDIAHGLKPGLTSAGRGAKLIGAQNPSPRHCVVLYFSHSRPLPGPGVPAGAIHPRAGVSMTPGADPARYSLRISGMSQLTTRRLEWPRHRLAWTAEKAHRALDATRLWRRRGGAFRRSHLPAACRPYPAHFR